MKKDHSNLLLLSAWVSNQRWLRANCKLGKVHEAKLDAIGFVWEMEEEEEEEKEEEEQPQPQQVGSLSSSLEPLPSSVPSSSIVLEETPRHF